MEEGFGFDSKTKAFFNCEAFGVLRLDAAFPNSFVFQIIRGKLRPCRSTPNLVAC
jgi:hypothetical protein